MVFWRLTLSPCSSPYRKMVSCKSSGQRLYSKPVKPNWKFVYKVAFIKVHTKSKNFSSWPFSFYCWGKQAHSKGLTRVLVARLLSPDSPFPTVIICFVSQFKIPTPSYWHPCMPPSLENFPAFPESFQRMIQNSSLDTCFSSSVLQGKKIKRKFHLLSCAQFLFLIIKE